MDSKSTQLIDVLKQIIRILDTYGETHWHAWMTSARSHILNTDYSGVALLLDAYGGMGSFNDLLVGQKTNEEQICGEAGIEEVNDMLGTLRAEAYALALDIKRHYQARQT